MEQPFYFSIFTLHNEWFFPFIFLNHLIKCKKHWQHQRIIDTNYYGSIKTFIFFSVHVPLFILFIILFFNELFSLFLQQVCFRKVRTQFLCEYIYIYMYTKYSLRPPLHSFIYLGDKVRDHKRNSLILRHLTSPSMNSSQ